MRKLFWLIVLLIIGVWLVPSSLYTVDRTEFVYLTQFGRHVHTFDGARDDDAGLHFKWPWPVQSVQRLDRRLQYFDLPGAELMTRDRDRRTIDKTLTIDAYVCWRIADGDHVDLFLRAIGTGDGVNKILGSELSALLGALIGDMEMNDLVSTELISGEERKTALVVPGTLSGLAQPDGLPWNVIGPLAAAGTVTEVRKTKVDARRDKLREDLLKQVQQTKEKYGIEVVDVRLRRTNHPATVRQAIYDRIISERERIAAEYESEGIRLAANIKNASDHKISNMKTDAQVAALTEKNQADSYVHSILNNAQKNNPEFFAFLHMIEFYKVIFGDSKSQVMFSMSNEIFKSFRNPPSLSPPKPGPMGDK